MRGIIKVNLVVRHVNLQNPHFFNYDNEIASLSTVYVLLKEV
jgi:hypothetical protein